MSEFTLPPLDVQHQPLDRAQQPRPWQLVLFGVLAIVGMLGSFLASPPERAQVARQDVAAPR